MTTAERKAVAFFAALAAAGAGARALGIGNPPGAPAAADRLALQRQLEAVDSAHARRERGRPGKAGKGRRGRRSLGGAPDAVATAPPPTAAAPSGAARSRRAPPVEPLVVDVNTADTLALQALPGVGPALARRIVADRAARGGYASMAELSRVRGIGAGLERRLAGAVTFTPGGRPSAGFTASGAGVPSAGVPGAGRYGVAPRVPAARWPAP